MATVLGVYVGTEINSQCSNSTGRFLMKELLTKGTDDEKPAFDQMFRNYILTCIAYDN